ncbi:MAG TPA: glycoside hydrolase family 38 C-terminal domain-containing protein [Thermoanaerobaculia bacterium]|nr:glycoside hydrolase family 38 C-terminal domain-containing protein [Thermoanaerobaculia bacterium]
MKRVALLLFLPLLAAAQTKEEPTLYLVGYAHLDTQWQWEYPQTIEEYLPNTLHDNFRLFEKYPHYVFNFSGANRYRMIKEYYPADFEKLRGYVKSGRWFPSGASMEESDVNSPSAESIIRQILYGSRWFRRELRKTSVELMLPDSFGFPGSLPSIVAHMGLRGFSTQKLTWGSAAGVPFNIGMWEGPDGASVIAAFNPGSYGSEITEDLRLSDWPARVRGNGVLADYHYYGTGDVGGAPSESSVARVEAMVTDQRPELHIVSATAEQMFLDIKDTSNLPRYQGELELTEHSAGSLTSQAYQKRWNRKNELLADSAERASVAAMWLGAEYPQQRLEDAWTLVMGGQFHDIAAGTSTPKAHQYSWNDEVLALNQFASVLISATETIASALDTRTKGTPVVVYNPLSIDREDVVEADLAVTGAVRVFGPDGKEVPSQISRGKVLFLARVPSVGWAVYDVQADSRKVAKSQSLKVDARTLENARYRIRVDNRGDIASIFDKKLRREILSAPARLALQTETPRQWPAWNMDWDDRQQPPRAYVQGPATARIVENGAARVALEITREAEGSTFVQTIRLAAGEAGNRIEVANAIDWRTSSTSLKATFPLGANNPYATYNWGVGTIQRGNNDPKKYEVLSHEWIDLTDASGTHGATILTGGKYGSDKPDDRTIRLTLIYTPGFAEGGSRAYADQTSQDFGHHDFVYGLVAHDGRTQEWHALRLEQPLIAFESTKHAGALGKSFSFLRAHDRVMALKKAEDSDALIVRTWGKHSKLEFAAKVESMHRVDGQERRLDNAQPCTLCTFAVQLASGPKIEPPRTQSVPVVRGQTIQLPEGTTRVHLLMAADGGDRRATFRVGDVAHEVTVQDGSGFIGQWDTRLWERREETLPPRGDAPPNAPPRQTRGLAFAGLTPGFIKPASVASFAFAKAPYAYSYLFAYTLAVPEGATTLTLPRDEKIRIHAVTTSNETHSVRPLQPLYDTLKR